MINVSSRSLLAFLAVLTFVLGTATSGFAQGRILLHPYTRMHPYVEQLHRNPLEPRQNSPGQQRCVVCAKSELDAPAPVLIRPPGVVVPLE